MPETIDSVIVELVVRDAKARAAVNSYTTSFDRKMNQIGASASRMERATSTAFASAKAGILGFVGALSVGAFTRVIKAGLDYAASLGEVAQSLGVGTKFLQEFRFAATQNGASVEAADGALGKFSVTLGKAISGEKSAVESFTALGISIKNLNAASEQQRFELVADGIRKIADPARQSAAAIEIFGRGAREIIPTLLAGAEGFRKQAEEAREFGLVLSDRQIQDADKTADKIEKLQQALQVKIAAVVSENATAIGGMANSLADLASTALQAVSALQKFFQTQNGLGEMLKNLNQLSMLGNPAALLTNLASRGLGGKSSTPFVSGVLQGDLGNPAPAPGRGGIIPVRSGGRGGSGRSKANTAERAAEAALRDQSAIDREIYSAKVEELRARQELSTSSSERIELAHQMLDLETQQRAQEIQSDVDLRKKQFPLKAAQIEAETQLLLGINQQVDQERRALIDRENDQRVADETLSIRLAELGVQRDLLSSQADLAVTAKDRRDIELRILDAQYEEERLRLEAIIASKTSTDAEKQIAQIQLAKLAALKAGDVQKVKNGTLSPLGEYRKRLSDESKDVNASIENAEVRAFERLEESLTSSVKQALHLHGIFGDLIGDLIQIAIRQLIIKKIVDAIGGESGGGGGFGGLIKGIGSIFTGGPMSASAKGRASGGGVSAGQFYRVNEAGTEGFRPAQSGTIIPLGQMPNAIGGGRDNSGNIRISLQLSQDLDARILEVSTPVTLEINRIQAETTVQRTVSEVSRQFNRPRL